MDRLRNLIVAALAASTCASPFLVFLALPFFDGGIHPKPETVAVGIHALAVIDAFLLLLLSVVAAPRILASLNGAVLCLAAVGTVGLLTLGFSIYVPRSVWGSLDHCVGILWYFEAALLTLVAGVAWSSSYMARVAVAASAGLAVLCCVILQIVSASWHGASLTPYASPGYLGIFALLASVPILSLRRRRATLAAAALVAIGIVVSRDLATILSVVAAFAVWTSLKNRTSGLRPAAAYVVAFVATLVSTAFLVLVAPVLVSVATMSVDVAKTPAVASSAPIDHVAIQAKPYGTLWRRSEGARFVVRDLASKPVRILAGEGFGSFATATATQIRSAPGRMPGVEGPAASFTSWTSRDFSGAPSMALDVLLSTGILGLAAFVALSAFVLTKARAGDSIQTATLGSVLSVGLSLRDLPPSSLPFMAVGLVAVSAGFFQASSAPEKSIGAILKGVGTTLIMAVSGFAAFASFVLSFVALKGEANELVLFPNPIATCASYSALGRPSDDVNRGVERKLLDTLLETPRRENARLGYFIAYRVNLENYTCLQRAVTSDSTLASISSLEDRNMVLWSLGYEVPDLSGALAPDDEAWSNEIERTLLLAPSRTDLLIPYVEWLSRNASHDHTKVEVERFSALIDRHDPVSSWLAGLIGTDSRRAYEAMRTGLANLTPMP